jgi:RNA polymerase subunit RPABC4/transcription elongation factor Spt4
VKISTARCPVCEDFGSIVWRDGVVVSAFDKSLSERKPCPSCSKEKLTMEKLYRVRYFGAANNKSEGAELFIRGDRNQLLEMFPAYGDGGGWTLETVDEMNVSQAQAWKDKRGLA